MSAEIPVDGQTRRAHQRSGRFGRSSATGSFLERERRRGVLAAVAVNVLVLVVPAVLTLAWAPVESAPMSLACVTLAVAASVVSASLASALWKRRATAGELVFSDLLLGGSIRRARSERRVAGAGRELLLRSTCEEAGEWSSQRQLAALRRMSRLLDAQDRHTRGHSQRVARHAEAIARELGLPSCEVARLCTAAALHDIGKLHTPRRILEKPGRLTDAEFAAVKRHPGDGADMLGALHDPAVAAMVRHHHERLDGSGYPDGLAGAEIPLGARIIAVADTFDAMTSDRAYRGARAHKEALDVLSAEAGSRLDAGAVSAFRAYYAGGRMVARWSCIAAAMPRLVTWLTGHVQAATAGTPSLGKALPTLGAAAVLVSPTGSPVTPTEEAKVVTRHAAATPSAPSSSLPSRIAAREAAVRTAVKRAPANRSTPRHAKPSSRSLRRPEPDSVRRREAGQPGYSTADGVGSRPVADARSPSTPQPAADRPEAPVRLPLPPPRVRESLPHVDDEVRPSVELPAVEPPAGTPSQPELPLREPPAIAAEVVGRSVPSQVRDTTGVDVAQATDPLAGDG